MGDKAINSNQLVIVLSGPSGVGKDAVLKKMKSKKHPLHHVVTVTTRARREGEKDSVDYHFVSQQGFQQMFNKGELLEWANVYGNYYGVPKKEVSLGLSKGMDVMIKVDVQGAAAIKKVLPQAVFIFLVPPSLEELEKRLKQRHSESPEELALRLQRSEVEMKDLPLFDYVITNSKGKVDEAVSRILAIIAAERCRVVPRVVEL
jgi:guanylate kinase